MPARRAGIASAGNSWEGQFMRTNSWFRPKGFLRGDVVEVRSEAEIAATLDAAGRLDGLPFMPEMRASCGRRFRIHRRADKTCVEGFGLRRMYGTVFLENLRCDGAAHDGCERGCLMFWKEAWLKPVAAAASGSFRDTPHRHVPHNDTPSAVGAASALPANLPVREGDRYVCQSTALAAATSPLTGWNPVHLVREMINGELSFVTFSRIVTRVVVNKLRLLVRLREIGGIAGRQKRNPKGDLALAPGEQVEVKSTREIAATLDPTGRNQGLTFEPDMTDFTQRTFEVDRPITRMIHEQSAKMVHLTSTVALKGVTCQGLCSKNCPRNNPLFWREAWLKRVETTGAQVPETTPSLACQTMKLAEEASV